MFVRAAAALLLLPLGCRPNPAFGQFDSDGATTTGADAGTPTTGGRSTGGSTRGSEPTGRDGSGVTSVGVSTGPKVDMGTDLGDAAAEIAETDATPAPGEPCALSGEPPEGLIACWDFDDIEGSTAIDEVGGFPMEFAAAPTPNAGLFDGTSIDFDGVAASATFPSPGGMPNVRFTLEMWMLAQEGWSDNAASIVLRPDGAGASLGAITLSNIAVGDPAVLFSHTSSTVDLTTPDGDYLACVAVSYDGQDATGYTRAPNEELAVVPLRGAAPLTMTPTLLLLVQSEALGLLDGVRVWGRAVGEDEICRPAPP